MTITNYIKERIAVNNELRRLRDNDEVRYRDIVAELQAVLSKIEELGK